MSQELDVTEQLKLLTPTVADRDALLFAAGQAAGAASVQTPRFWKWACGLLATSQVAMISLWFLLPAHQPIATTPNPVTTDPIVPVENSNELAVSTPIDPQSYLAMLKNDDFNRYPQRSSAPLPVPEKPHRILTPRWNGDLPY